MHRIACCLHSQAVLYKSRSRYRHIRGSACGHVPLPKEVQKASSKCSHRTAGAAGQGRVEILEVHSRGKKLEEGIDFKRVARATAGSTGADLMNVMNTAGMVAVRRGAKVISEDDIFQARTRFNKEKCSEKCTEPGGRPEGDAGATKAAGGVHCSTRA